MHVHFLDPYQAGGSLVHRLDARVKIVLTAALILSTSLLPDGAWPAYLLLLAMLLAVEIISELGISYVLKRSALAAPFVLAALPLVFIYPGETLATLKVGQVQVALSLPGCVRFFSIALKSWISVQAAIVLASSTAFPDLLVAMRALKIPRIMVSIFSLMWRYLFVLADEMLRMNRARLARSGISDQPGLKRGGSLAWRAGVTGNMAGSLFLRAFERSDRIYNAMLARGYDGEVRVAPLPPIGWAGWVTLLLGLSAILFVSVISFI